MPKRIAVSSEKHLEDLKQWQLSHTNNDLQLSKFNNITTSFAEWISNFGLRKVQKDKDFHSSGVLCISLGFFFFLVAVLLWFLLFLQRKEHKFVKGRENYLSSFTCSKFQSLTGFTGCFTSHLLFLL